MPLPGFSASKFRGPVINLLRLAITDAEPTGGGRMRL